MLLSPGEWSHTVGHSGAHTMVNRKKEKSKDTKKETSLFACNVDEAERNVNMETKRGLELELIDTQRRNEACEGEQRRGAALLYKATLEN